MSLALIDSFYAWASTPQRQESSEKAEKRKKKKSFYAKLKRQEDDKMAELAAKYRDRAQERREGLVSSSSVANNPEDMGGMDNGPTSSGYHAVAPDAKSLIDAAERRKRMIQESKFLGGDMEHTHLVKGEHGLSTSIPKARPEVLFAS